MPKIFFLIYNGITGSYSLAEGLSYQNRREITDFGKLDEKGLVDKLRDLVNKEEIDRKRESYFVLYYISEPVKERIERLFKKTKIKVIHSP